MNQVIVYEKNGKTALKSLGLIGLLFSSGLASAAIDVDAVTTEISSNTSSVLAIGTAVLGVVVLIAAFRWARSAIR